MTSQPALSAAVAGRLPRNVALVNGSKTLDGHTAVFRMHRAALNRLGIPCELYQCVDPSRERDYPSEGHRVPGWKLPWGGAGEPGLNRLFPVFASRLRSLDAELIHVNDVYLARLARDHPNVVVTIADLAHTTTRFYSWGASFVHDFNLRFVTRCRGAVTHSAFVADQIARVTRLPRTRVHIVPHFAMTAQRPAPRQPPGPPTPDRPWNLLYVATDRPHKNLAGFFALLVRLGPAYTGTLVARVSDTTRRRIGDMGLGPRMRVVSDLRTLDGEYERADVLVHPSLYEGFGIPLIEAMGQALPVVASDLTAIPEVVGDGGQLLPPHNLESWVTAVQVLRDPAVYLSWSERSWKRSQDFTLDRTATALATAYRSVLSGP